MAKKTTKKKIKKKAKTKVSRGKTGEVLSKVLAVKARRPTKSLEDISLEIDESYRAVYEAITTPAGKMLVDELEKQTARTVQRIRAKALAMFEQFIVTDHKPEVQLSALKFAIGASLSREEEAAPEELIFETIISETGIMEQTTRKIYHKTTATVKPPNEDEEAAEDESVPQLP